MKTLVRTHAQLSAAGRWDIDFHLPATLIQAFDQSNVRRLDEVAHIVKENRDPGLTSDETFRYVDISSVDAKSGRVLNPQDVLGEDAPSRARKVVQAFDLVISTVRPTRGAIAVVPEDLHNEIASTGFAVVRANADVNPFYLHFALRMQSTREQFRKWSTGSSYPAILESDVAKTLIPVPSPEFQDAFAIELIQASRRRESAVRGADEAWEADAEALVRRLFGKQADQLSAQNEEPTSPESVWSGVPTIAEIRRTLRALDAGE